MWQDISILIFFFPYREFSNERTRVERRETFRKLRMRENFSKAFEGYFQWIIRAGTLLNHRCLLASSTTTHLNKTFTHFCTPFDYYRVCHRFGQAYFACFSHIFGNKTEKCLLSQKRFSKGESKSLKHSVKHHILSWLHSIFFSAQL